MTASIEPHLPLFAGYGIELEYALVDRETLSIRPIADQVLAALAGEAASDVSLGPIACSNELVLHLLELKTDGPVRALEGVAADFQAAIRRVSDILDGMSARLMPSAMHPLMNPLTETKLWPHENNDIYETFDSIFDCRGHGWANLQSTHLNLPFQGDDEFGRLHAAIRMVLPALPALAASSPIVEGRISGLCDTRLDFYRHNADRVPSVAGAIVPEPVYREADYRRGVLDPIARDVAHRDPKHVLDAEWTNSRGAIARFSRGSIEIRILDVQECPQADMAVVAATAGAVRALVEERWAPFAEQKGWPTAQLAELLFDAIARGPAAVIEDASFLKAFDIPGARCTLGEFWQYLVDRLIPANSEFRPALDVITRHGCLARRIVDRVGRAPSPLAIETTYRQLCDCLVTGRMLD